LCVLLAYREFESLPLRFFRGFGVFCGAFPPSGAVTADLLNRRSGVGAAADDR
jgi:hypothetical protein